MITSWRTFEITDYGRIRMTFPTHDEDETDSTLIGTVESSDGRSWAYIPQSERDKHQITDEEEWA